MDTESYTTTKLPYVWISIAAIPILVRVTEWADLIHKPANVEYITSATLVLCFTLKKRYSPIVPVAISALSDAIIGCDAVSVFVWTAWMIIGICIEISKKFIVRYPMSSGIGLALVCSSIFYLWTNFGVWAISSGRWYPNGVDGLIVCLMAGIPFALNMLLNNLIFLPIICYAISIYINKKTEASKYSASNSYGGRYVCFRQMASNWLMGYAETNHAPNHNRRNTQASKLRQT